MFLRKLGKFFSKSFKIFGNFAGVTSLLRARTFFLSFPPMETFAIDSSAQELDFKKGGDLRGFEGGSYDEITKKLR